MATTPMRDFEIYERRAREARELADLVNLPQNRARYRAIAEGWQALYESARIEPVAAASNSSQSG
jgi:hypothetical protein